MPLDQPAAPGGAMSRVADITLLPASDPPSVPVSAAAISTLVGPEHLDGLALVPVVLDAVHEAQPVQAGG